MPQPQRTMEYTLEELHPVDRMNLNKFIDERLKEGENEWKTSDIIVVALKYAEYKISSEKQAERERVVGEMIKEIEDYYQKNKTPARIMPRISPSRSHYIERHHGFLSGILAIKNLLSKK